MALVISVVKLRLVHVVVKLSNQNDKRWVITVFALILLFSTSVRMGWDLFTPLGVFYTLLIVAVINYYKVAKSILLLFQNKKKK